MKVRQFKKWLEKNYPHLLGAVTFGDLNQETTEEEFRYFKKCMRQASRLPVKVMRGDQFK